MPVHRRHFLKKSSLAAAGTLLMPRFLQALGEQQVGQQRKIVVIIQLSGGNDGLNTVIPVRNDIYYKLRPKLAIGSTEALKLNEEAGLHPELSYFKELYDAGELAILNNVGYPNPDRSHFRSMDIWHTASDSTTYLHTGWIGRYLDAQCKGCDLPTQAIELDEMLSLALKGEKNNGIATTDPRRLYATSTHPHLKAIAQAYHQHHEPVADYLYKTLGTTLQSAEYIFKESRRRPSTSTYPNTQLAKSLQIIASLALSDINTTVYYVSLGSFDTHINQAAKQARLFAQLNGAVKAFVADIKAGGRFNDLLLFTFSEFGRRVNQNASGGTDHGTANNMFFIGGSLKKQGIVNALPDLTQTVANDLQHTVDFREVYHMVLQNWLKVDATAILGANFAHPGIV
jgi:uncharacterized protein (DUF1501 family)